MVCPSYKKNERPISGEGVREREREREREENNKKRQTWSLREGRLTFE